MKVPNRYLKIFGIDDLLVGGVTLAGGLINNMFTGQRQEDQQRFNAQQQLLSQEFNSAEAVKNRDFQSEQAQRSMDFSANMSNTAYQRSMADMRKAGLNPILAYTRGQGASTPTGSAGSGGAASSSAASSSALPTQDAIGPAVASAIGYQKTKLELENMKATNQEIGARTGQAQSASRVNDQEAKIREQEAIIRKNSVPKSVREKIEEEAKTGAAESWLGQKAIQGKWWAETGLKPILDAGSSALSLVKPSLGSLSSKKTGYPDNQLAPRNGLSAPPGKIPTAYSKDNPYQDADFNSRFKGW